jgi:hypothetical protein
MTSRDPIILWRTVDDDRWFVACRLCKRETVASSDDVQATIKAAHRHLLQAHLSDATDLRQEPGRAE